MPLRTRSLSPALLLPVVSIAFGLALLPSVLVGSAHAAAQADPANVDAGASASRDPARIDRQASRRQLREARAWLRRAEVLQRKMAADVRAGRPLSPREREAGNALLRHTDQTLRQHWDRVDPATRERYRQAWAQAEALQRQGQAMAAQPEVKAAVDSARDVLLAILENLREGFHAGVESAAERSSSGR